MKKKLFVIVALSAVLVALTPLATKAAPHTVKNPVYVWTDESNGNIDIYDGVPSFDMPENYHIEVITGIVVDNDHNGKILTSTDGVTPGYDYICYRCVPAKKGQTIVTVCIYKCDDNGDWGDNIICRYDMIEGR